MARRWIPPSAWPRATADMLYVVAWPVLAEADDTALRRLRAQYHPREADLIGPHFTLVFGAPRPTRARLRERARRHRRGGRSGSCWIAWCAMTDAAVASRLSLCRAGRRRGRTDRAPRGAQPGAGQRAVRAAYHAWPVRRMPPRPSRSRASSSASICRCTAGSRSWRCCRRDGDRLETLASVRLSA